MKTSIFRSRCAMLFILLTGIDQYIKYLIRLYPKGQTVWRVAPLFEVVHCRNTGAAFSLLSEHPWLIAAASVCLIALILIAAHRLLHLTNAAYLCVTTLLAGAAGNLIDRIVFSSVTDYIRLLFIEFAIFNFADILITLSVSALLFLLAVNRLENPPDIQENKHGANH